MRISFTIVFFLIKLLCNDAYVTAQQQNYYLSPTGNDNNNGTSPATAWKTLARASNQQFMAGDSLLLEALHLFEGTLEFNQNDQGSAALPIVVSSYGVGKATIYNADTTAVAVNNLGNIHFKKLLIEGGGDCVNLPPWTFSNHVGLFIYMNLPNDIKLENIVVDDVHGSGFLQAGLRLEAAPYDGTRSGYNNLSITRSSFNYNMDNGLIIYGKWDYTNPEKCITNLYIADCVAHDNEGVPCDTIIHSGSGIAVSGVDGCVIEHCIAYSNGAENHDPYSGPVGIWLWDAKNALVQFCESYNNESPCKDGGGFDLDVGVSNSVVQYNYSHDNVGPGYLCVQTYAIPPFENNVFRYNISENDASNNDYGSVHLFALSPDFPIVNTYIYNNTVYKSRNEGSGSGPAISIEGDDYDSLMVFNNIFVTENIRPMVRYFPNDSLYFWNNNYYSLTAEDSLFCLENWLYYHTLPAWRQAGFEMLNGTAVGTTANPLLKNAGQGDTIGNTYLLDQLTAYQLEDNSPLRDEGLHPYLTLNIPPPNIDFYGSISPQNCSFEIGAHELYDGTVGNIEDGKFPDTDGDYILNVCDICVGNDAANDTDNDGFCDDVDNCITTANPNQSDSDGDKVGDVCDVFLNCVNIYELDTLYLAGSISSYQAGEAINSRDIINSGAIVTYLAGESISLQAGFRAKAGCLLQARINPCSSNKNDTSAPTENNFAATVPPNESALQIFPNPSNGAAWRIHLPDAQQTLEQVQVYDIQGKLLLTLNPTENICHIQTAHLSAGLYLCVAHTHDPQGILHTQRHKLLLQR